MHELERSISLEEIIASYVESCEAGRSLPLNELLRKYPQFQDELAEFVEGNAEFLDAAEKARQEFQRDTHTIPVDSQATSAPRGVSSLALNPPRVFGAYTIQDEIDRGGMGIVYRAVHTELGRTVALKLIRSGELASDHEIARFRIEAEAAAALAHPGIVPIYEVGQLHGLVYYTMAYIDGKNLSELLAEGSLAPKAAMKIVHSLCSAMDYAHERGVTHRDLKPANVLIDKSGQPIIIDFGLAKIAHRDHALTATGQIVGTPAYMAPEQAQCQASLGPSADIYALGALLHFLCSGQPPFTGPTPFDVLLQVLDRDPPKLSRLNRKVGSELDFVCRKAMEKAPQDRYATAAALGEDLERILRNEPITRATKTVAERLEAWWRREPILAAHVIGIGMTMAIVLASQLIRHAEATFFIYRMALLLVWFLASFALQGWVVRARWRDTACLSWATIDVLLYTTLIGFADPPRSMLLIGYPMLIVASSLFYRKSFVLFMTSLCVIGFLGLAIVIPKDDFVRIDFCAIFLSGLGVICLMLTAMIHRVRGMSSFFEDR